MSNVSTYLMQSLTEAGRRQSEGPGLSSSKLHGGQYELEEIAIVSKQATPNQVKYGSGPLYLSANGPKVVPGILTTGPYYIGERLSASSGTKLDSSSLTSLQDKHRKSSTESLKLSTIRKTRPNILETINQRFRRNKHHQPHKLFSSNMFLSSKSNHDKQEIL